MSRDSCWGVTGNPVVGELRSCTHSGVHVPRKSMPEMGAKGRYYYRHKRGAKQASACFSSFSTFTESTVLFVKNPKGGFDNFKSRTPTRTTGC